MKRNKPSAVKLVKDMMLLGTFAFANRCIEKLEVKKNREPMTEEELNSKLTRLSIIYHVIGIFYNE